MVICGLYGRDRQAALQARMDDAYETLMDAARRKAYDVSLFPEGQPSRRTNPLNDKSGPIDISSLRPPTDPPKEIAEPRPPLPPEPAIGPETEITGSLLRQLRESRGIDLATISQKTKVAIAHLKAIEEERFPAMPAPVYVRGFLIEYAKLLRLDVGRILGTYFARYKAIREEMEENRG
jgi:flagellar biosynthesis protein FlhG